MLTINPDEYPIINYRVSSPTYFSLKVSQKDEVSSIYIWPQMVIEISNLIKNYALDNLVIFGEHDEFIEHHLLEDLASDGEIPFSAIDSETIVLSKDYLLPFLRSTPYLQDIRIFDIKNGWDEYQVISQVLAYREHDWRNLGALLPKLAESQLFLENDESRFQHIESNSTDVSKYVFVTALQTYTSIFLANSGKYLAKPSGFPQDLLNMFWKGSFCLTILKELTEIEGDYLIIGVSEQFYSGRDELVKYTPEFRIMYDIQEQKWLVEI